MRIHGSLPAMRLVSSRVALLLLSVLFLSNARAFEWELVPVKSRDFLKLKDISEFYRLKFSETSGRFQSERPGLILKGKSGAKQISINGVAFDLQYPVTAHAKGLLLSRYDLAMLIDPLLNPVPRNVQDSVNQVQVTLLPPLPATPPKKGKAPDHTPFMKALAEDLVLVLQSQKLDAIQFQASELTETGPSPAPPKPTPSQLPTTFGQHSDNPEEQASWLSSPVVESTETMRKESGAPSESPPPEPSDSFWFPVNQPDTGPSKNPPPPSLPEPPPSLSSDDRQFWEAVKPLLLAVLAAAEEQRQESAPPTAAAEPPAEPAPEPEEPQEPEPKADEKTEPDEAPIIGKAGGPLRICLEWSKADGPPSITTAILMPPGSPKDDDKSKPWDLDHRVFVGNMWDAENLQFATLLTSELNTLKPIEEWNRIITRETSVQLRSSNCPALIVRVHASSGIRDNPDTHKSLVRELSVAMTKAVLRMDALLKRQSLTDKGVQAKTGALRFESMESLEPPEEDDKDRDFDFGMRLNIASKEKTKIDPSKIDLQVYAVDIFNEREVNLTAALPPRFLWKSDEPTWKSGRQEVVDVIYRYPRIWELLLNSGKPKTTAKEGEGDSKSKEKSTSKGSKSTKKSTKSTETPPEPETPPSLEPESDSPEILREILLQGRVRNYGYVARLVYDGDLVDEIAFPRPLDGHLGWFATLWPLKP